MPKVSMEKMTPGRKAAHTRKWRQASRLAHKRAKDAKTFTKYVLSHQGYKVITLDTRSGYESQGIVDLVAIKREAGDPDKLTLVLLQVKGGCARVSRQEKERLRVAVRRAKVVWNVAEKPGQEVLFLKKI